MQKKLQAKLVRKLLDYCPETGQLTWRKRSGSKYFAGEALKTWNAKYAGNPAFKYVDPHGYCVGSIQGGHYKAHRVIWLHYYGAPPCGYIDHINGDKTDNRISNLRVVTSQENVRNTKRPADNTSGRVGVSWYGARKKWQAYINGRVKREALGYFETFEEAVRAREAAEKKYGYHENHGRG